MVERISLYSISTNPYDFDRLVRLYDLDMNNENFDTIFKLLNEIDNVNTKFKIVSKLLQKAANSTMDNLMLVSELINAGADVNLANDCGLTPLHFAVLRRKHNVVNALIESGANINAMCKLKRTPLHFAICNYENNKQKRTSLSHSSGPNIRIVEALLKPKNILINKGDILEDTPLISAVRNKQLSTVLLLLEKGADPNIRNQEWETPLHIALYDKKPSLAILVQLLTHQASLNGADREKKTPIDILIQNIGKKQTFRDVCTCLKVVALHYSHTKPLKRKLQSNLHLLSYLENCCVHVRRMRSDIIAKKTTVFDFVTNYFKQSDFDKPVIQVYKPVVERLLAGYYLKYLNLVLLRVSKSNLFAVLEIILFKYCENIPKTPNGEETIDITDHKELSDIKDLQEITVVEECNEFSLSKNCKDTPVAKDSKDTPDSKDIKDTLDAKDIKDSLDAKDTKDSLDGKDIKDSLDAKESKYMPVEKHSMDTPVAKDNKKTPNAKDSKDTTDAKNCPNINFKNFFLIINLLSEYFSTLDVFHIIAAFSTAKISELYTMNYN